MQKKKLKIMVFLLLAVGVVISLSLSVRQKTNWDVLMKENVEALTTPEADNPYYPCVKAHGFCIINNIERESIAFIRN